MDEELNLQIQTQNKISDLVSQRQEQISNLKSYYDYKTNKKYKGILYFGQSLNLFSEVFNKYEYRQKCDDILSLALSMGKILDLNNSIKTILIAIKIFEEHNLYLKYNSNNGTNYKNWISKSFSKTDAVPLTQNNFIKKKLQQKQNIFKSNNANFNLMKDFYNSLYKNDSNFFIEFNKYLSFQTDSKSKNNAQFQLNNFNNSLNKIMSGNYSVYYKFYTRTTSSFELDYASIVISSCDIFFMIYNKMMDKICYNPNLLTYIETLDDYIVKYFISATGYDLQKLAEYIVKSDVENLTKNLDKIYG